MKKERKGFFAKMLSSEHKIFETSMFGISVILSLALVIGISYYVSLTYFNNDIITDEEANASSVTEGALTVREQPDPTATPDGNMIINDYETGFGIDEELANASAGYTTATVNMRSEPALTASVIGKVPIGTKLIFNKLHDNEWMEVQYNGQTGYINAMYLSVEKPKPIETVTPRPTAAATKSPKPTKSPKATKTPKPTKVPDQATTSPEATPEPTATAVVTEEPTPKPTQKPTPEPTQEPTPKPTQKPTPEPTPEENTATN